MRLKNITNFTLASLLASGQENQYEKLCKVCRNLNQLKLINIWVYLESFINFESESTRWPNPHFRASPHAPTEPFAFECEGGSHASWRHQTRRNKSRSFFLNLRLPKQLGKPSKQYRSLSFSSYEDLLFYVTYFLLHAFWEAWFGKLNFVFCHFVVKWESVHPYLWLNDIRVNRLASYWKWNDNTDLTWKLTFFKFFLIYFKAFYNMNSEIMGLRWSMEKLSKYRLEVHYKLEASILPRPSLTILFHIMLFCNMSLVETLILIYPTPPKSNSYNKRHSLVCTSDRKVSCPHARS